MGTCGVTIISHSEKIAEGIYDLLKEISKDVCITYVGGYDGGIGTSFEDVFNCIESNTADKVLAFYDLGSAKMNLESVAEVSEKNIEIFNVPVVEGAYTATALLQAEIPVENIIEQLNEISINK